MTGGSPTADALTYADQRIGPNAQQMTVTERIADMLRRHGSDSGQSKANISAHQRSSRLAIGPQGSWAV
jgi:hypothetical protein